MNPSTRIRRALTVGAAALSAILLSACVAPQPVYQTSVYPYEPRYYPAPQTYVDYGQVANIEVVQSQTAGAPPSGGGAVAGGVVGGLLGNQIGHGGGRAAATLIGVMGGAILGNTIEANNRAPRLYQSYRISVQVDNGSYRVFDVASPGDLRVGDRVRIDNGRISRI